MMGLYPYRWWLASLAACSVLWYMVIAGERGELSSIIRMLIFALFLGGCAAMPIHIIAVQPDAVTFTAEELAAMMAEKMMMLAEIERLKARPLPLCLEAQWISP